MWLRCNESGNKCWPDSSSLTVYPKFYQRNILGAMGRPAGGIPGDVSLDNHCLHLLVGGVCWSSYCRTYDHTLWEVMHV